MIARILFFLMMAGNVQAAEFTMSWTVPATNIQGGPTTITGYNIYCAPKDGQYKIIGTTTKTAMIVTGCATISEIAITAIDDKGKESYLSGPAYFDASVPLAPVLSCRAVETWNVDPQYPTRSLWDAAKWPTKVKIGTCTKDLPCGEFKAKYSNQTSRSYRLAICNGKTGVTVCKKKQ